MTMLLIREFYIDSDPDQDYIVVYTDRCSIMPHVPNWQDHAEKWADRHIPGWTNIEVFEIATSGGYVVQR
jgi:hypothetical protein